jgi:DNA-binding MarR family transcriptional regulator|tara:strand:+ start:151 stop:525 length:375 start_codon:yes stop_codon:yes gene_type:complete
MDKIFSELYKNLQVETYVNDNPLKKFLFQSKQSILVLFYIASQKNQKSTLEDICYNISSKVISRSTIQNLLKEGVQLNFLEKEVNEKDKREKFYKYTNEAKKITQEWFEEQKKVFLNLNDLNFK